MKPRDKGGKLGDLGEFGLIEKLTAGAKLHDVPGILGAGDDCAVLPWPVFGEGMSVLVTTDALIEEVHFSRSLSSPYDIGWKSLAVSLSDVAAMGGVAKAAVVALTLSADQDLPYVEELYRGIYALAELADISIVGGDTVRSPLFGITVTVLGAVRLPAILRSGACSGDDLWLSGTVGGAELGLRALRGSISGLSTEIADRVILRHRRPQPRSRLGLLLCERSLATSLIDISDGLLQDAGHIAVRSNKELIIEVDLMPCERDVPEEILSTAIRLSSGDDYELLFSAPVGRRSEIAAISEQDALTTVTRIGRVQEAEKRAQVLIQRNGSCIPLTEYLLKNGCGAGGYQHF